MHLALGMREFLYSGLYFQLQVSLVEYLIVDFSNGFLLVDVLEDVIILNIPTVTSSQERRCD